MWLLARRIKLHYSSSLSHLDLDKKRARFEDAAGVGEGSEVEYELLVGCDGIRSRVREALEAHDPSMHHEIVIPDRSYQGFCRLPKLGAIHLLFYLFLCLGTWVAARSISDNDSKFTNASTIKLHDNSMNFHEVLSSTGQ